MLDDFGLLQSQLILLFMSKYQFFDMISACRTFGIHFAQYFVTVDTRLFHLRDLRCVKTVGKRAINVYVLFYDVLFAPLLAASHWWSTCHTSGSIRAGSYLLNVSLHVV